jgi:peptidoglycan biosynthesis protein MviN/MurJ (putative lipid II flippase)
MIAGALCLRRVSTPIMALGLVAWSLASSVAAAISRWRSSISAWPRGHGITRCARILLMLPTLFGSSVAQINLLLDTRCFVPVSVADLAGQTDRLLNSRRRFGVALGT